VLCLLIAITAFALAPPAEVPTRIMSSKACASSLDRFVVSLIFD